MTHLAPTRRLRRASPSAPYRQTRADFQSASRRKAGVSQTQNASDVEAAQAMLKTMAPKVREIFLMRMVDGLAYGEIAQRLGLTPRAVEKHLLRAFAACAEWSERNAEATLQNAP